MEARDPLTKHEAPLRELVSLLRDGKIRSEEHAKATHDRFNVFTCLLKENDEVRLHTRFLHCLLDPHGSHDCGDLFLQLFFQTLLELGCTNEKDESSAFKLSSPQLDWKVHKETRRDSFGQLDLLLESSETGIAIENKIHAYEQERQIVSYDGYLRTAFPKGNHLIYLTLDGKKANSAEDSKYLRISYSLHILHWLEQCLRATYQFIPINQALLQYKKVIRRITHQDIDPKFMEPAINLIRRNPDLIRFSVEIQRAIGTATKEVWETLQNELIAEFNEEYHIVIHADFHLGNGGIILQSAENFPFEIWIERDQECLGIGVCVDRVPISTVYQTKLLDEIRTSSACLDLSNPQFPRFPTGWHNLLKGTPEEQSATLLEQTNRDKILRETRKYLSIVVKAHIAVV